MKEKLLQTVAAILAAVLFLPVNAYGISARSAIAVDGTTGRVIYEKDADRKSLIASTTKIMTALVICENCNVLDRMRIPKEAVGIEGSSMYLQEGEVLTLQELLYGMMLSSGNDAAVALAIYCGGTVEGFAEMMNDRARQLGMRNSHFVNPNGLDAPEHYSTARDLGILASAAMENPIFAATVSAKTVTVGNRCLRNHNKLLWMVEGADGVKTGYTKAAGRILVSSAQRDGRRMIAVTIDDGNDWQDHAKLLEQGFRDFEMRTVISSGDILGKAEVLEGEEKQVSIVAGEGFSYALSKEEIPRVILSGPGFVYAPVVAGKQAGTAYLFLGDKQIGKIPVLYEKTIERKPEEGKSLWQRIKEGIS